MKKRYTLPERSQEEGAVAARVHKHIITHAQPLCLHNLVILISMEAPRLLVTIPRRLQAMQKNSSLLQLPSLPHAMQKNSSRLKHPRRPSPTTVQREMLLTTPWTRHSLTKKKL